MNHNEDRVGGKRGGGGCGGGGGGRLRRGEAGGLAAGIAAKDGRRVRSGGRGLTVIGMPWGRIARSRSVRYCEIRSVRSCIQERYNQDLEEGTSTRGM